MCRMKYGGRSGMGELREDIGMVKHPTRLLNGNNYIRERMSIEKLLEIE